MTRAIKGGETGINGENYQGGQFLPNTTLPKGFNKRELREATKKQEIAPYKWEVAPEIGLKSIFTPIKAFIDWNHYRATGKASPHMQSIEGQARMYPQFDIQRTINLIERWNDGERWM
jgi:hypothetical protein